jgi:hypothetical protein
MLLTNKPLGSHECLKGPPWSNLRDVKTGGKCLSALDKNENGHGHVSPSGNSWPTTMAASHFGGSPHKVPGVLFRRSSFKCYEARYLPNISVLSMAEGDLSASMKTPDLSSSDPNKSTFKHYDVRATTDEAPKSLRQGNPTHSINAQKPPSKPKGDRSYSPAARGKSAIRKACIRKAKRKVHRQRKL